MLFVHDHKFKIFNSEIYTSGSLTNELFSRYEKIFGEVTILANKKKAKNNNGLKDKLTDKSFFLFNTYNIFGIKKLLTMYKLIKNENNVILRMPSVNSSLVGLILLTFKRKYLVELVGCPYDALNNHGVLGKIAAPIMTVLTKLIVKKASHTLYVTEKFLQNRYPTNGESTSCSDVKIKHTLTKSSLKLVKSKEEILSIGTAGVIDVGYKGQQYVIKAVSKIKKQIGIDMRYYLAGPGDNKKLKKTALKYGVQDNIIFLGLLNNSQISDFYKNLDVYVQPSLTEGLPRALIEAMSHGCYCIGSRVGGIPELISTDNCFEKKNIEEIINKILRYYSIEDENYDCRILTLEKSKEFNQRLLDNKRELFYISFKDSTKMN